MIGVATTPAANYLFDVDETKDELPTEEAEYFHFMVARLLFLCRRARPDIHTAVAFLSTRVQSPTGEDMKKLARTIKYLRGTIGLYRKIEAIEPIIMKWHIDGSFAVHPNMRSHTGATMSLGEGSVISMSTKQKINTRSSTEAELVAVNDAMGQVLWTRYFMRAQTKYTAPAIIFQDNKSTILLEENGRASSGKMTRHINIRYFFVHDRVRSGEIEIEHCPTEEMDGDFFTKPLQGSAFYKFRKAILNMSMKDVATDRRSVLEQKN